MHKGLPWKGVANLGYVVGEAIHGRLFCFWWVYSSIPAGLDTKNNEALLAMHNDYWLFRLFLWAEIKYNPAVTHSVRKLYSVFFNFFVDKFIRIRSEPLFFSPKHITFVWNRGLPNLSLVWKGASGTSLPVLKIGFATPFSGMNVSFVLSFPESIVDCVDSLASQKHWSDYDDVLFLCWSGTHFVRFHFRLFGLVLTTGASP